MASDRQEPAKTGESGAKAPADNAASAPAGVPAGGLKSWLPLGVNILVMPLLAYLTTTLLLLPKLNGSGQAGAPQAQSKSETGGAHGETGSGNAKSKFTAPLSGKVLVNIAGTMGTRYLLANLTLVSPQANLRDLVEKNDAELRDVAAGVLAAKTIADLEKPGARNLIRTELLSVFNNVLGDGLVSELYITEFAIQ